MKKLFALMLALALCMTAFAAVAEEEIPAYEVTPSYEGVTVPLGETGLTMTIPNDWVIVKTADGRAAYATPDTSLVLDLVVAEATIEEMYIDALSLAEQGVMTAPVELYLNDNYYMMYGTVDGTITMVYLPLDETMVLSFVFTTTTPEVYGQSTLLFEILGTVAYAE